MDWKFGSTDTDWIFGSTAFEAMDEFSIVSAPPATLLRGGSYSLTCENVSEAPSASTLDGQPITVDAFDVDSIDITIPLNSLASHGSGREVSITVAGVTQTFLASFQPDTGRDFVTLENPEGGSGTIFEGMTDLDTGDPLLPVTGGQVIWSETTTPNQSQVSYPVTIGADGWPEIDVEGAVLDGTETFSFQYLLPGVSISNVVTISLQDYLVIVAFEFTGTGGLVLSGSADYSGSTVGSFDFTGSGGLTIGGSAVIDTGGVTILPPSGLVVIIDTSDQVIQCADRPLDPYDTEWVVFAWDERIADATVIASDWVLPSDWNLVRTAQNQEISARGRDFQSVNAALVDVNNAAAGRYVLSNRVSLSDGRQYERSVKIRIKEM